MSKIVAKRKIHICDHCGSILDSKVRPGVKFHIRSYKFELCEYCAKEFWDRVENFSYPGKIIFHENMDKIEKLREKE